jgi:hypothetical protein
VLDQVDSILDEEDDQDLVAEFRRQYLYGLDDSAFNDLNDFGAENVSTLLDNVLKFYNSIPSNSPIRSSIVRTIFADLPVKFIAEFLGLDVSSVYKSTSPNKEVQDLNFYLTQLEFLWNRLGDREKTLFDWFIIRCLVPSGRNKRYFMYGTPESMFLDIFLIAVT